MIAVILSLLLLLFPLPVLAKYDPLTVPNNKFGIHLVDVNDIPDAAGLVNSTGGDWGYATIVIQEDDRNKDKWQHVFDSMRRLHLIPIVRLATHVVGDSWSIPSRESIDDWARFLNELNWPTENRYVIVFNEPNHANEWGKQLDPEGYADMLQLFTDKLHAVSPDFFVMPASMDVSAASDGLSLDAGVYLTRMKAHTSSVFDSIDGWASHAYPNPGFSGSPYAIGRGTLYSYLWELNLLKNLGISSSPPVFITETGWIHREGISPNFSLLTSDQVGNNLKIAAATAWQDPRIVAITPFVLNYQGYPFDHFSWKRLGSSEYYPQFVAYQSIAKIAGTPKQQERYSLPHPIMPKTLVAGSTYTLTGTVTNSGQNIVSQQDGYGLTLETKRNFSAVYEPVPDVEPSQSGTISLHIETPPTTGLFPYTVDMTHLGKHVTLEKGVVHVVPPPAIRVSIQLGWRNVNDQTGATVLVYDDKTLLHKFNGVHFINGSATIPGLRNIVPGQKYRIVVLAPYYLPTQRIIPLSADVTDVSMPRMLPLDFNADGALSIADLLAVVRLKPNFILSLFIGP